MYSQFINEYNTNAWKRLTQFKIECKEQQLTVNASARQDSDVCFLIEFLFKTLNKYQM